jgi:hypothetical protein
MQLLGDVRYRNTAFRGGCLYALDGAFDLGELGGPPVIVDDNVNF